MAAVERTTTIWLARHAEAHNPGDVLYARLPRIRLSEAGTCQARALAEYLAPRPLVALYSSPMLRARKTAAAIQERRPDLRVRLDRDLIEVRTGWQGRPLTSLQEINYDFYTHRMNQEDDTLESIRDRMRRWVARVLRRHAGGEIVGVSHGDPVLTLVADLRGLPLERAAVIPKAYIPTGIVFRLRFDVQGRFLDAEQFVPHQARN